MADGADGARGPCPHGRPAGEPCDACNPDEIDLRDHADVELREDPVARRPTESRSVGAGSGRSTRREPERRAGRGPTGSGGSRAQAAGLLVLVARQGLCTLDPPGIAHLEPETETAEDAVRQLTEQGWRVLRTQVHPRHTVTILGPAE